MASNHIYRSLQEGEVRVLELQPHLGNEDSPLRGVFRYCWLDDEPITSYETISWYWGDPTPSCSILLGSESETLRIPENAWRVLRRVRYSDTVRNIWIDSICINQSDLGERAAQVEVMGQVYSRCAGNIVYLGEVSDDIAKKVFTTIENLYKEAREETEDFTKLQDVVANHSLSMNPTRTPIDEEDIRRLTSCPWFSRIWVVQEVALSTSNSCLWGRCEIQLHVIFHVVAWLGGTKLLHLDRRLRHSRGFFRCLDLSQYDSDPGESEPWPTVRYLLVRYSARVASDARDKVYALIGLTRWGRERTALPALLRPDYHKSAAEVFRDATRCAIQEDRSLRMLHYVGHRAEDHIRPDGLCSWAFDPCLDPDNDEDSSVFVSDMWSPHLMDAADLKSLAESLHDPDILISRGFVTDVVKSRAVARIYKGDIHQLENLEAIINEMLQGGLQSPATVVRTLTAGSRWHGGGVDVWQNDEEAEQSLYAFQAFMQRYNESLEPTTYDPMSLAGRFHYSIYHAATNRKLFHVQSGLLGLGPRAVMEGDIIAVLQGSRSPFVLRSIAGSEAYQFIGAAYIANYPSIQELEATHQMETFHLR